VSRYRHVVTAGMEIGEFIEKGAGTEAPAPDPVTVNRLLGGRSSRSSSSVNGGSSAFSGGTGGISSTLSSFTGGFSSAFGGFSSVFGSSFSGFFSSFLGGFRASRERKGANGGGSSKNDLAHLVVILEHQVDQARHMPHQ
jgi:hypothetical protein